MGLESSRFFLWLLNSWFCSSRGHHGSLGTQMCLKKRPWTKQVNKKRLSGNIFDAVNQIFQLTVHSVLSGSLTGSVLWIFIEGPDAMADTFFLNLRNVIRTAARNSISILIILIIWSIVSSLGSTAVGVLTWKYPQSSHGRMRMPACLLILQSNTWFSWRNARWMTFKMGMATVS